VSAAAGGLNPGTARPRLVVIGNGMAAAKTLEELERVAPGACRITVFGAEPHPSYNRVLLSSVLAGEAGFGDIALHDEAWYRSRGIALRLGTAVVAIDRARREVVAADGARARYDRLLIATGSTPLVPAIPGAELAGVATYRDVADTAFMIAAAARVRDAVVVGGGLLGLEAANGLARRGMRVTVVHLMPWLMERQLDAPAAGIVQRALEARGIRFVLGAQARELPGYGGAVRAVKLADGTELAADLVVFAAGVRPNADLARRAGLACGRGVLVSDTMQTYDPRIYAVGECAEHRGVAYGLVEPIYGMARVCAQHLAGFGAHAYRGAVPAARLKVSGIDVYSAGRIAAGAGGEEIVCADAPAGVYRKFVLERGRLAGALLVGDARDAGWYQELIETRRDVAALRGALPFGRPVAAAA
jgi:nitrite reductase (NADH) large subunit